MANGSVLFSADRKSLIIKSKYDPDLVSDIKSIKLDRRRYNPDDKTWVVRIEEAARVKELAEEYDLTFPAEILKAQEEKAEQRAALEAASRAQDLPEELDIPGLKANLRAYQKAGIAYMIAAPRSIQGDDMGLGKTLQSLATAEATNAYPALVISPSSLLLNWKAEAATWLPGRKVHVLKSGTTPLDPSADITIVSYDIAKKRGPELGKAGFKSVFADEAHYLKNNQAQRTKMIGAVIRDIPRAHLLTGTPVTNRPADLIAPLQMLGHLDAEFGGWKTFATRYCNGHQTRFGWDLTGASNLPELNSKLRATCLVRRLKKDVLTELPPKQRSFQPVELSNRSEYHRTHRALLSALSERQEEGENNVLGLINQLKELAGEGKVDAAKESIQGYMDADKKVVVFGHHHAVLDGIEEFLKAEKIGYVRLDGATSTEDRQAHKERFQNNPACRVFLSSTKAGGVGLTLTAASDVLIVEQEWVPADLDQAEDRTHRIGQLNCVNAVHLIAEDSIDSRLLEVVNEKRDIAEQAITGDASNAPTTQEEQEGRQRSVFHDVLQTYVKEAKASNLGKKRSEGHRQEKAPETNHEVRLDMSNPEEVNAFIAMTNEARRKEREALEAQAILKQGGIKR